MMETELTGDDLRAFASANGLVIMSHRNPDRWAEQINKNNGMCPCGKECPCDDCTCKFYETMPSASADGIEKNDNEDEGDYVEISNPEIARAIQTLEDVRQKLITMPQDTTENASGAIRESEEMVKEDAEKHECGECAKFMEGLARKLRFLKEECEQDSMACVAERDLTVKRIEDMQATFIAVDKAVSESENDEGDSENKQQKAEIAYSQLDSTDKQFTSEFRACVSKKMNNDLVGEEKRTKLCAGTKMCGQRHLTKEEALSECIK